MHSSPERPSENEGVGRGRSEYEARDQSEDFDGRKKVGCDIDLGKQKAYVLRSAGGLVLFAFPNAFRR